MLGAWVRNKTCRGHHSLGTIENPCRSGGDLFGRIAAVIHVAEHDAHIRMPDRPARAVFNQILLRDIGCVVALGILGQQVVEGLIPLGAHVFGDRLIPFLGVAELRIDIEDNPRKL